MKSIERANPYFQETLIYLYCLLLILCFGSLPSKADQKQPPTPLSKNQSVDQQTLLAVKKALKSYHSKSTQIQIEQEIFLSAIETSIKTQGLLRLKKEKFYLKLEGNPTSIMLFDGTFFWYQADTSEKIVFRLKNHPQIQILRGLFSEESFLNIFSIQKSDKKNQEYFLQLLPKKPLEGLSEVFIKIGADISEVRLIWKDLNNWQKYKLSKPIYKDLPDKDFQFDAAGFQIITKTTL